MVLARLAVVLRKNRVKSAAKDIDFGTIGSVDLMGDIVPGGRTIPTAWYAGGGWEEEDDGV